MRLYIYADAGDRPPFHLPWGYHLSFRAFVYDALDEYAPERAEAIHDTDHAPPFSFSEFVQTAPVDAGDARSVPDGCPDLLDNLP